MRKRRAKSLEILHKMFKRKREKFEYEIKKRKIF